MIDSKTQPGCILFFLENESDLREIQIGELFHFNQGSVVSRKRGAGGCPGQSWLEDNGRPSDDPEAMLQIFTDGHWC